MYNFSLRILTLKRIYEKEWFGINFNSISKLSLLEIADEQFYDSFYVQFYKKYMGYNDLPKSYIHSKLKHAQIIYDYVNNDNVKTILSFGCGNGLIEYRMPEFIQMEGKCLDCFEVSATPLKFLRYSKHCNCISEELPNKKYDLIYMMTVEYALDNVKLISLLSELKRILSEDGRILLCSITCNVECSLSVYEKLRLLKNEFLEFIRHLFMFKNSKYQLWGYRRSPDEILSLSLKSGLEVIKYGNFASDINTFFVELKK